VKISKKKKRKSICSKLLKITMLPKMQFGHLGVKDYIPVLEDKLYDS